MVINADIAFIFEMEIEKPPFCRSILCFSTYLKTAALNLLVFTKENPDEESVPKLYIYLSATFTVNLTAVSMVLSGVALSAQSDQILY